MVISPWSSLRLVVIKNSIGGDGVFNFYGYGKNGSSFNLLPDFQIQTTTTGGQGSSEINVRTNDYLFYEDNQPGWKTRSVNCSSSDGNGNFIPIEDGVEMDGLNGNVTITCVFNDVSTVITSPLLIIPGTLGTEIDKGSEILWPDIGRMASILKPSDGFMDPLAFDSNGNPVDASLTLGQVLGAPHPTFDYSKQLVFDLIAKGYSTSTNPNLFLFPYDWRDDIKKNSDNFLKPEIDTLVASSTTGKIDIVAHSQGGLLIKRLLYDHPEYAGKINKLVFVGTPNLGAPQSAKMLLYGDSLGVKKWFIGLDPAEMKKISQNMPAVYQMLPSQEILITPLVIWVV